MQFRPAFRVHYFPSRMEALRVYLKEVVCQGVKDTDVTVICDLVQFRGHTWSHLQDLRSWWLLLLFI